MKRLSTLFLSLLFSTVAFAQIQSKQSLKLRKPNSVPSLPLNSSRAASQVWLDYETADAFNFGTTLSEYIWTMNMRYTPSDSGSLRYCIVSFDSLYDNNTNTAISNNEVTNITVDSFYTFIGHQNVSGSNDTLIARIINLNGGGYPGTTTLWADTIVTNSSLSTSGDWLDVEYLQWNPNYSSSMKRFGIELDYYDPSKVDTCGFIAGYFSSSTCAADGGDNADPSLFYPNSYAYWTTDAQLIPTSSGGDIFYDCDNSGTFTAGDGANYIQDILIGAWITVTTNVGIHEDFKNTGIALYQNIPNPLHNATDIKYQISNAAKSVTLSVHDMVGKQIMEVAEGIQTSGMHTIQLDASKLAKGIYTYTLNVDGSQLTKRMIVE